jgi:hypothetical protein
VSLVRGLSQLGSSLVSNKVGGSAAPLSPQNPPDQHVRRLLGDFSVPEVGRIAVGERITSRHAELDGHCASGDEEPLDLVWIVASFY